MVLTKYGYQAHRNISTNTNVMKSATNIATIANK